MNSGYEMTDDAKAYRDAIVDADAAGLGMDPATAKKFADIVAMNNADYNTRLQMANDRGLYSKEQYQQMATYSMERAHAEDAQGYGSYRDVENTLMGTLNQRYADAIDNVQHDFRGIIGGIPSDETLKRQLRQSTYDLATMQRWGEAMRLKFDRWQHEGDEKLAPDAATAYARELGSDMKFDRPTSIFDIEQAVFSLQRKKDLEEAVARYDTMLGSRRSAWTNIVNGTAAMAGSVDPLELVGSVAAGFIIPGIGLGIAGKAALLAQKAWRSRKLVSAVLVASRMRNTKTAYDWILRKAASGYNPLDKVNKTKTASDLFFEKFIKQNKAWKKMDDVIASVQNPQWDSLNWWQKAGLEGLTMYGSDAQFIRANRQNSVDMGVDLYSEKEAMMDYLYAAGFGIGIPAVVRGIGALRHISPVDLVKNRLNNKEREVKTKVLTGEMSKEEGAKELEGINAVRDYNKTVSEAIKDVNPTIKEVGEALARSNTTSETLFEQMKYVLTEIINGNIPKLHLIPSFEDIFTNVDARVLGRLANESAAAVFGSNIIVDTSKAGIVRVKLAGERGLLSKFFVCATDEAEAIESLGDLYRGLVLRDQAALDRYIKKTDALLDMWYTFDDEVAKILKSVQANSSDTVMSQAAYDRIFLKYVQYRYGDEGMQELTRFRLANNTFKKDGGEAPVSALRDQAVAEFDALMSAHLKKTKAKKGDYSYYLPVEKKAYDKAVREGVPAKDRPKLFGSLQDFLADVQQAADEANSAGRLDDFLENYVYNKDQLENAIDALKHNDVTADTNINFLFGERRCSFEELKELNKDNIDWTSRNARTTIEYRKNLENKESEWRKSYDKLDSYGSTSGTPVKAPFFATVRGCLKFLQDAKAENYKGLREALYKELNNNKTFQQMVVDAVKHPDSVVHKTFRKALVNAAMQACNSLGYGRHVPNLKQVVGEALVSFDTQLEKHPDLYTSFLSKETVAQYAEEGEKLASEVTDKLSAKATAIEPVIMALDTEFARLQMQSMHNIDIMCNHLSLMRRYPHLAKEILAGAATQTIYDFKGAGRSVESMSQTWGLYFNSLKEALMQKEASNAPGKNLYDLMQDTERYKDAITTEYIKLRRGEKYVPNSDAAIIAKIMLDHEASLMSSLRKFGSNFDNPGSVLKRDQINWIDAVMDDKAFDDIPLTNPDMEEFARIYNPVDRKLALWAFRDFDLDGMFNRLGDNVDIVGSLNETRDYILSGGSASALDPADKLAYSANIRYIKSKLLGEIRVDGSGNSHVATSSWAYHMRTGTQDLRAYNAGEKTMAVDEMDGGIKFKSTDAEVAASRLFGFNSVEEQMQREFARISRAKYTLDIFGTHPIAMAEDLVHAYNKLVSTDKEFSKKLIEFAENKGGKGHDVINQFKLSNNAMNEIKSNIMLACGLGTRAPSAGMRFIRAFAGFTNLGLLAKAAGKSASDYSTITESLIMNGLMHGGISSRLTAFSKIMTIASMANEDKGLRQLLIASNVLNQEELAKAVTNDPGFNLAKVSDKASWLDKFESASRRWSNTIMNKVGFLELTTNINKTNAALSIQYCMGQFAEKSWNDIAKENDALLQYLIREGISQEDWEFIRKHGVDTLGNAGNRLGYMNNVTHGEKWFVPQLLFSDVSDDIIKKEMQSRGITNITKEAIDNFREEMAAKAYGMVESGSNLMVSIPSGRLRSFMRGNTEDPNSWTSMIWELALQYQSFGVSLVYNMYGRRFAKACPAKTGINIVDLINPMVRGKIDGHMLGKAWGGLLSTFIAISLSTFAVDTAVNAMAGRFNSEPTEMFRRSMISGLGAFSIVIDTIWDALFSSGTTGAGFEVPVFPSISRVLSTTSKLIHPFKSSNINNKWQSLAAALANQGLTYAGLKQGPLTAAVVQSCIGSYLDMVEAGGYYNYAQKLKARERRGDYVFPWDRDPRNLIQRLQDF